MKPLIFLSLLLMSCACYGQKVQNLVVFGGCTGACEITKEEALALDSLYVKPEIGSNIQIYQFIFTLFTTPAHYSEGAKSGKLSPKMKAELSKIKPGDKIIVDLIKVKYPDGRLRDSKGITLTVK